jgi:hypothetical protein
VTRTTISDPPTKAAFETIYEIHPRTGMMFEIFYADRALETFGRHGAGWFWSYRRGASRLTAIQLGRLRGLSQSGE